MKKDVGDQALGLIFKFGRYFCVLAGLFLSQYVFYSGQWPTHGAHYDFPGLLVGPFYVLLLILTACEGVRLLGLHPNIEKLFATFAVIFALIWFNPWYHLNHARQRSISNVESTGNFTETVSKIVAEAKKDIEAPILFESHDVLDYEPIGSVNRFLHANNVRNPRYLILNGYSDETYDSGDKKVMAGHLRKISVEGLKNDPLNCWTFQPLSEPISDPMNCIALEFGGPSKFNCKKFHVW